MKNTLLGVLFSLFLLSCGEQPVDKLGNVKYKRGNKQCVNGAKNHWLLDLKARNGADSVYLNTISLGRKIEVHQLQLDSTSNLYTLLTETCKGDSIVLEISAAEFYTSMNGKVPSYLRSDEQLTIKVWMRDKLTDLEHISYKKVFENDAIRRYTEKLNWNGTRDSSNGVVYEKLKTNNGVQAIQKAKVKYIIKSLNEQLIASSKGDKLLVYDSKDKNVLGGIRYLVGKLGEGESARAVVPSDLAYGSDGNSRVPGYMPILLEVEIVEIIE